jgi:hypothetical protein
VLEGYAMQDEPRYCDSWWLIATSWQLAVLQAVKQLQSFQDARAQN